ncbi:hypothetical protein SKAU_G00068200 [Synaphobranchus kaupii]|uniref:Uncharacterized protein n=1 Tax=Synaphobranchus kaupii TaxID=118154 RepID=A0A9Q1G6F1_SYNKA|nr:hypothetical protein SKAU_G00068200 [Synaphobranchus kaupii]
MLQPISVGGVSGRTRGNTRGTPGALWRSVHVCERKHDPHGHLRTALQVSQWALAKRPSFSARPRSHANERAVLTCVINNSNSGQVVGSSDTAPGSCPLSSQRRADMKEPVASPVGKVKQRDMQSSSQRDDVERDHGDKLRSEPSSRSSRALGRSHATPGPRIDSGVQFCLAPLLFN